MIALRRLWRYRLDSKLEVTEQGQRCDWTRGGLYDQLGWVADADLAAIAGDWRAVGDDLRSAIKTDIEEASE